MPNWKKVITSGSNAHLNHITASGNISSSGQLLMDNAKFGSDSVTIDGPGGHITASGNISGSATSTGSFGMGFFKGRVGIGDTFR